MFLNGRLLASRMPRRAVASTVLSLALALSAGTLQAAAFAPETGRLPGFADNPDPVAGKNANAAKARPADAAKKAAVKTLDPAAWPGAGSIDIPLPAATVARSAAEGAKASVGGLPVAVRPVAAKGRVAAKQPAHVKVTSLSRQTAQQWGSAALLTVERGDAVPDAAPVQLSLDYSKFTEAAGGGYGSRLRLIQLPACAATKAPGRDCPATPTVIASTNDTAALTVSATVAAAPTAMAANTRTAKAAPAVYALAAGSSSSKGDYKATSLSPSASWSVANSSGGFSWNYPLRVVPTPGGLSPTVGLGYSSQSADGRTSATNNQGSWVGEGFGYEPGYVERSYKPCSDDGHPASGEQCWAFDNATVMLDGSSSELIKDDKTGKWHFASESGSKIEQLSNADTVTGNGDNDGEHWKITTTDGTEYYFGLNRLPGWSSGKEETASTWTSPVFGDDSGEPCYNATFANAHCDQAWRWNLDFVKDTHGNAMSYFYGKEANAYALNGKTDVNGTSYTRGGYLKHIDYGQRADAAYAKAPARVVFGTKERCLPTDTFDCAAAKFTTANAANWPDTPVDQSCTVGTKCTLSQASPTFWTTKRLTGITTQMSTGPAADAYGDVDAWTFTHTFTDNGDATKTLWLAKIDHEGKAGGSEKLPSLELGGVHLKNRVDSDTDNTDAIHRFRLATVVSETGAQLDVTYAPTECTAAALPKPGESTKRCYPVVWAPPGTIEPKTDWFHKYVVQEVRETDRTGGGDDLVTHYDYEGNAGWRHAEPNGIIDEKFLTWGQWQGYGKVTVTSGNGQTPATRLNYTYLQGLDGDKLPGGGTRSEKVKDSTGTEYTGDKEYTGFEIEAQTYDNATGGKVIAKTISEPWKYDTATQTRTWGTNKATLVKTGVSRGYTQKSDNSWQATKSTSTYDTSVPNGRLQYTEDLGDSDPKVTADDRCTRLWYADDPARNIYELASRSEAVSVTCAATPDRKTQVLADERTTYDGQSNAVKTERLTAHNGTTATYQVTGVTGYDKFGRPISQTDAGDATTTTGYTDLNGLITQAKNTNALGHVTTTDYAQAWGVSVGQTDPNGKRTDLAYDALGRLTSVWLADRAKTSTPSIKYTYNVRRDKPTAIKTEKIDNGGNYGVEYQLYDSLLRPRQKQTEGPGGTRMVGDVFYNGIGKPKKTNDTYNAAGTPSDELLLVANGAVGAQSLAEYDGLGRTTADIFQVAGVEQWRTTTTYDGERTHVDPPTGQMPTTSIADAQGRTTELRHYHSDAPLPGSPGAQYDSTKYTYTPSGQPDTVTDAQNHTWSFQYDQLGRQIKTVDPDAGPSTTAYDGLDRPIVSTDARGKKTSTVYDKLGRTLTTWNGDPTTGTKLTESRYDKAGRLGQAWASLRYTSATEYFATVVQGTDAFYRPLRTDYIVPAAQGALKGTYSFTSSYNRDGTVQGAGLPAAGALPSEAIAYTYDELQRPSTMTSASTYVTQTVYTPTSQLKGLTLSTGGSGKAVQQTFAYEKGTDRLTSSKVDISGVTGAVKASQYAYDQAGNVLSISDTAGASPDVQCFAYDSGQRLAEAWTPAAAAATATGSGTVGGKVGADTPASTPSACAAAPGTSALGGPAAYWKSYTTDSIGNRTKDVDHDTSLDAAKDVSRTYTYGENGDGPHAATTLTEKKPTGESKSTYGYDDAGNTTTRTTGGNTQSLQWNDQGELNKTVEADGTETSYLYDTDGSRVLRRDASATTVYLPGLELRLPTGGNTVEATRYYSFAGESIAVRQNNGDLSFLASDHQGTSSLAINSTTGVVSQRRFDPYGANRGTPAGAWPGEKGFVGGTRDAQSGLTHLGAREYDADIGKFMSVDPIIDYTQPEQMNAYSYSHNSPVTYSDPTGTCTFAPFCTGSSDPCAGTVGVCAPAKDAESKAQQDVDVAQTNLSNKKHQVKQAAKILINIVKELIGIDAALDCFSSGDLGACGETLLNVAGSFAGGIAGKILAKYGTPWKWAKGIKLAKKVVGLVGDLISGIRDIGKASKTLGRAKDALKIAREKAKVAVAKGKELLSKGPECTHSFLPGTLVQLSDGTSKPIEQVALGDKVTTTEPDTGETSTREVVGTITTEDDKHFVDLTVKTETTDAAAIVATTTHPFWVESEAKWINAGDLKPGMNLHTPKGDRVTVEAVRHFDKRQRTHDLTVAGIHTYYVLAGATPVLVHNCGDASDELLDIADGHIGKTNTASEIVSADGKVGHGVSGARAPSALTPQVRTAAEATGHHRGCSEIGALCELELQGADLTGTKATTVKVMGGSQEYGPEAHGELYPKCPSCRALFDFLDGKK
ncbi:polymorphic toxin-type HINT domain-containing protein [Streptomyces sp. RKAG337]|uniref:polymorphic toxin-type HINT domain-containing protein n=1 Tax=Streptomyces sp. RKAG337 TaxID=2893404 RepID=UPI002553E738|nr:polymorphic toxin-type HINT domain-containing protein [Streptomyces sp. RKAG337]